MAHLADLESFQEPPVFAIQPWSYSMCASVQLSPKCRGPELRLSVSMANKHFYPLSHLPSLSPVFVQGRRALHWQSCISSPNWVTFSYRMTSTSRPECCLTVTFERHLEGSLGAGCRGLRPDSVSFVITQLTTGSSLQCLRSLQWWWPRAHFVWLALPSPLHMPFVTRSF